MQDFKRESRVEYVPFHEMKSNLLREFSNVLSPLIYECLKRMVPTSSFPFSSHTRATLSMDITFRIVALSSVSILLPRVKIINIERN